MTEIGLIGHFYSSTVGTKTGLFGHFPSSTVGTKTGLQLSSSKMHFSLKHQIQNSKINFILYNTIYLFNTFLTFKATIDFGIVIFDNVFWNYYCIDEYDSLFMFREHN